MTITIFFLSRCLKIIWYSIIWDLRYFLFNVDETKSPVFFSYAIFLHRDRQISWWFYVFERDPQFLYTEIGNFPEDLMSFNALRNFYTEVGKLALSVQAFERGTQFLLDGCFAFWECPIKKKIKKWIEPIDGERLPQSETTKIRKSPKIDLRKNSTAATIYRANASNRFLF